MLLIYHQTFTVAFANSAPLNQVLKYKDSALQTNWILSMKIGHIIQRCACLLPYLKGTAPCYIMLLDRKRSENPSVSPGRPVSAAPSSFLAPCAARSPKIQRQPYCGENFTPRNAADDDVDGWPAPRQISRLSLNWNICYLNYSAVIILLQDGS